MRPASPSTNYRVQLPLFEGPLDLLLSLVDKEKLDITEISLAAVASQYQAYLESLERLNLELESSYVVVFAQLLEIKSRVLLPDPPVELLPDVMITEEGLTPEEAAQHDLVEQLKAYKLLKEAADWLGQREVSSLARYPHPCELAEPDVPELDVSLSALAAAWVRLDTSLKGPRAPVELKRIEISVPERVQQLWAWLTKKPRALFSELLGQKPTRQLAVVTFLALLELARRHRVRLAQEKMLTDEIEVTLAEGANSPPASLREDNPDAS